MGGAHDDWPMPPLSVGPAAASAAADLAVSIDLLLRRLEGVAMPRPDLDGWASLCAGEYRAAVCRLAEQSHEAESALLAARRALG